MSTTANPIQHVNGSPLNDEQKQYLTGFFAGIAARGLRFSDVEPAPATLAPPTPIDDLICEERVKRELHPLDAFPQLVENAIHNRAPEKEDAFRFKWSGLFYLAPNKDGYTVRLR